MAGLSPTDDLAAGGATTLPPPPAPPRARHARRGGARRGGARWGGAGRRRARPVPLPVHDAPLAVTGQYLPALDGLRALAVAGVLAYHLGFGWMSGGYLGVDLF
ncbi:MAG TPA: hypothetical protein VHB02_20155, partial [Acidimicrobiales bacterium]|nr:hypothetical protein [Acidimicrobiales bacterium]